MGGYVKGLRQNRVAPYPPRRKSPPLRMQPTTIQQKYAKATDNDQRGAAATRTAHANLQKGLRTCTHGNKPPTASARTFCKFAVIARPWGCRAEHYNKLQASGKQVTRARLLSGGAPPYVQFHTPRVFYMAVSPRPPTRFRRFRRYSSARNTRPPCDSGILIVLADICHVAQLRMTHSNPYRFASRSLQAVHAPRQAIAICRTCDSPDARICPLCSSVSCGGCTELSLLKNKTAI